MSICKYCANNKYDEDIEYDCSLYKKDFSLICLNYKDFLYDCDENCDHIIVDSLSGITCSVCGGWFCF